MNNKTKDLERMAFGIACMFGVYWIYLYFLKQRLPVADIFKTVSGLVFLYVFGLGLFMKITKKVSVQKYERKKISFKTILLCFLLQFTAIMVLSVAANISAAFGFDNTLSSTSAYINTASLYMLFMLLIFNPVIEEIVFRKIFANKLLKYGEGFYMIVSSFCFAVVHGVSLGVPQIIYTFILGMIWSYLMVKTGDIRLVIIMHALSNLFGSIILQTLLSISMAAAGVYSVIIMLFGAAGLILLLMNKNKVMIDGESGLIQKEAIKDMVRNKGIVFYTALTLAVMLFK